jgi:hypothetical protein
LRLQTTHRVAFEELLSPFDLTLEIIQERIDLHRESALKESCESKFYVGGRKSIDYRLEHEYYFFLN